MYNSSCYCVKKLPDSRYEDLHRKVVYYLPMKHTDFSRFFLTLTLTLVNQLTLSRPSELLMNALLRRAKPENLQNQYTDEHGKHNPDKQNVSGFKRLKRKSM